MGRDFRTTGQRASRTVKAGPYMKLPAGGLFMHRGGTLPQGRARYLRIPLPLAIILGPLAGALYVIVLPFAGVALLAYALALRVGRSLGAAGQPFLELVATPGWLPGHSYLGRHLSRRQRPEGLAQRVEDEIRELSQRGKDSEEGRE